MSSDPIRRTLPFILHQDPRPAVWEQLCKAASAKAASGDIARHANFINLAISQQNACANVCLGRDANAVSS